jgi:hypothetical protein
MRPTRFDEDRESAVVELRELGSAEPAWTRKLGVRLADDEWGGFQSFRVASPGDIDGDGRDDIALAVPSHELLDGASFCGVLSRADGSVLWRTESARGSSPTTAVAIEGLNYGIDRLPDRDGDGVPDLLVSHCDPGRLVVLSGRTGAVLKRADL